MNSWKIIEISEEQYGKVIPYVSIGHNRLAFNKAACDLIDLRHSDYKFAQFLREEGNQNIIGVRFWREEYERTISNSVPLIQKESKGKAIGGIDIANSYLLKDIFGSVVTNNKVRAMYFPFAICIPTLRTFARPTFFSPRYRTILGSLYSSRISSELSGEQSFRTINSKSVNVCDSILSIASLR